MLGDKVREVRKRKQMTLEQLAEVTELTAGYISQLERNLTEPSISTLRRIAAALETPLYSFLEEDNPRSIVIRAGRRKKLSLPDSQIEYEYITPTGTGASDTPKMEIELFTLKAKTWADDKYVRHPSAEECVMVIKGELTFDCGDETYILKEGDSIYLKCNTPHNVYNHTDETVTCLMCITPPVH